MRHLLYSSYLKFAEKELDKCFQLISNPHLSVSSYVVKNINLYLAKEFDRIVLPSFALEVNIARIRKELKGKTSQQRYKNFFIQKAPINKFLFDKYPRLQHFLNIFTDSTINSIKTCLERINTDWNEVIKTFSLSSKIYTLCGIKIPPNGDRHHQGNQTLFLEFNNNFKLVYKPDPVSIDSLIDFLIEKINSLIEQPLLTRVTFLIKEGYRWRLFLNKKEKVEFKDKVRKFYLQAGGMLALSYILNATDLHMDNFLVNRGNLYFLDNETFFHHFSFRGLPKKHDVYFTGFITNPKAKQKTGVLSGLQGGTKSRLSILTPFVENEGTDKIRVRFKKMSEFIPHNRIFLKNRLVEPKDYKKEIVQGFEKIYKLFGQNKNLIFAWMKKIINKQKSPSRLFIARQLIRPTSYYSFFIQNLFQPQNLNNQNYLRHISKKLKSGLGNIDKRVKKLIPYEIREITNLNIPYFFTDITKRHLYDSEGNCYKNFFETTGIENFKRKLTSLSNKDLALQIEKILLSL